VGVFQAQKPQKPTTLISSNGPWKTPEAHNTHFLKRALENQKPTKLIPQMGLRTVDLFDSRL